MARHKSCSHSWEGHFIQCFFGNCSFNFVSQPSRPCLVTLLQIRGINAAASILSVLLQMPARKKHTGVLPPKRFWKWIQPLLAWEIMEGGCNLGILALAVTKPPAWPGEWNLKSFFSLKKKGEAGNKYHYNFHLLWEAGSHLLRGEWTWERETVEWLLKQHEGHLLLWRKRKRM